MMIRILASSAILLSMAAPALAQTTTTTTTSTTTATPDDPTRKKFGVGFGWSFPADLQVPNTVSARFRMVSGLTVEPTFTAQITNTHSQTRVTGPGGGKGVDRFEQHVLSFGANLRKPMAVRRNVEMLMILAPEFTYLGQTDNPEGVDNRVMNTTNIWSLGWGLGVEYFPKESWSLSLDARNPLFSYSYGTTRDEATNTTDTNQGWFLGATFDPTVRAMVHLYH